MVSLYDATTGALINRDFILPVASDVHGLAVAGGRLYVACGNTNEVRVFNATDGTLLYSMAVQGFPWGVAIRNSVLYIACAGGNRVATFEAATGRLLNPAFLSGVNGPGTMRQIAIYGDVLYVARSSDNAVGAYNAITGAEINKNLVTGLSIPYGLAVGFGSVLGRGVYLPKNKTAWGYFPGVSVGGRIVLSAR